jgi:hypothetical protein
MNTALSLYKELLPEISSLPGLQKYINSLGPLPIGAVLFGMCSDRKPFLLNVHNPAGPHILIECGRPVLQTVSESVRIVGNRSIETVVLSNDWGVPFYAHADQMILALASWAHGSTGKQTTLLLVDGLENVLSLDFDAQQNFRWLLLNGQARGVYVVASYSDKSEISVIRDLFSCHMRREKDFYVSPEEGQGEIAFRAL